MSEAPTYLTKKQVAELLQCSMRPVQILTAKGRICRPVYIGPSSPRWHRNALVASLDNAASQDGGR